MKELKHYPLMSIVVLNWNGLDNTKICLEHLKKLEYPNYEIIVVDNGSKPAEKKFLRDYKGIIYVDNPVNRGFTGGHIDGLAKASGEFIVLLNNDAVMQKNYLDEALKSFQDPEVAVVGGRSYFWNDDQKILDETNSFYSYQNIDVRTGEAFMSSTDYGTPQIVNNVSGSAVVVRRSVIDEVGYLYDRFFAYFEETDLFARIKRAGYKVLYNPDLHIWHRNGASSGASSGSHFFYYQIFRNRFIFAMRNFETRSLFKFLYIYARMSVSSLLRWWLRPGNNKVMHRAYAKAGFYNLLRLPVTINSRTQLKKQLGKSNYNHIIYGEQTGVSYIYDCTGFSKKQVANLRESLAQDSNPLHEYVLVVTGKGYTPEFDKQQSNLRYVIDKQYFDVSPLNLGCLAARFDWMALCDATHVADADAIHQATSQTFAKPTEVVAFGDGKTYVPTALVHKSIFTFCGGLGKGDLAAVIGTLISYASRKKTVQWSSSKVTDASTLKVPVLSRKAQMALDNRLKTDESIANDGRLSAWGKIKAKYYRIYQFTTLFRWLFLKNVTLYLKAARIKNLIVFTLTLRRKALALELKHIRNEVILSTTPGDLARQKKVTKQRLDHLMQHSTDIPVFIICRDRVNDLKKQLAWLEKHGLKKIIFIDNDSVYPPLVELFNTTDYQVIKLYRNVGHTSPWTLGITRSLVGEDFYIVNDPDVLPTEECPDDVIKHFLELHKKYPLYLKVGFGLRIDDLPDHYPLKNKVIEWEEQFWKQELEPHVFEAGVDTTFALYKPFSHTYKIHPSIRTGMPYAARHLPWYVDPAKITEEERHYRYRADHNVSSWNADELEDRYAKELAKQKNKK